MRVVWRIQSRRHPLINSEGARVTGGRWNQEGTPVVYAPDTVALAAIEVMVHHGGIPEDYVGIRIDIPDESLPAGPRYRLEKEIKNVITSLAKACHLPDRTHGQGAAAAHCRSSVVESSIRQLAGVRCPGHTFFVCLRTRWTKPLRGNAGNRAGVTEGYRVCAEGRWGPTRFERRYRAWKGGCIACGSKEANITTG